MIIAYFIIFCISLLFKTLHWPFASLLLVISPLLPFLDIFIQLLRKKEDKLFRVLSSLAIFGISFFILFKMLLWPGSNFIFIFSILTISPLIIFLIKKGFKQFKGYRRVILVILILFSGFIFSISPAKFQLAFMIENPFDKNETVPFFIRHKLAYNLYHEGEKEQSLSLLEIALDDLETNCLEYLSEETCNLNKIQVKSDIEAVKANNWKYTSQLYY